MFKLQSRLKTTGWILINFKRYLFGGKDYSYNQLFAPNAFLNNLNQACIQRVNRKKIQLT